MIQLFKYIFMNCDFLMKLRCYLKEQYYLKCFWWNQSPLSLIIIFSLLLGFSIIEHILGIWYVTLWLNYKHIEWSHCGLKTHIRRFLRFIARCLKPWCIKRREVWLFKTHTLWLSVIRSQCKGPKYLYRMLWRVSCVIKYCEMYL